MQTDTRGAKHRCFKCQTLFYDLKRPALICPRCGADQADAAKLAPATKRTRKPPAPKPAPKPVESTVAELAADETVTDEEVDDDAEDDE